MEELPTLYSEQTAAEKLFQFFPPQNFFPHIRIIESFLASVCISSAFCYMEQIVMKDFNSLLHCFIFAEHQGKILFSLSFSLSPHPLSKPQWPLCYKSVSCCHHSKEKIVNTSASFAWSAVKCQQKLVCVCNLDHEKVCFVLLIVFFFNGVLFLFYFSLYLIPLIIL